MTTYSNPTNKVDSILFPNDLFSLIRDILFPYFDTFERQESKKKKSIEALHSKSNS